MIIKTTPIGSKHGAGVISYAMNKEEAKLVKMQHLQYTSFGPPNDHSVFEQMNLHQKLSGKKCKEPFFRIEACPPPDKTGEWTMEDWQKLCDDTLNELAEQGIDLRDSQLICYLHRDSGKLHLHIIASRIDMDGKLINAWQCKNKSIAAANAIAKTHGWSLAAEVKSPERKSKIRNEALEVLANMEKFDMKDFFAIMRARGYVIQDRWSMGKCVGYSIGKDEDVMFKSSQLTGRDLMPSRIEETWKKMHATPKVSYIYTTDYKEEIPFSIPKPLDDVIQKEIEVPEELYDDSDLERDEDWDAELADRPRVARGAAAILVGLMLPDGSDGAAVGGGGGGVQGELSRWDGLPAERQDDYIDWARRAAHEANEYYHPKKVRKSWGWNR